MKRARGFKIGRRLTNVFKWIIRRRKRKFLLLSSKISTVAESIRRGAKRLCHLKSDHLGYTITLGQERHVSIPKGHLAVYVGQSDGFTKRVMVPVVYFNHPLFGQLLKEAERVHGFNQPGGITIPCGISEFENVQTRIATWNRCHRR
ncbi:hypothetical protein ACFE04_012782 [Oxalis oulophora]